MKKLLIALLFPASALSQKMVIEQDLDTVLIPSSVPITIKTYTHKVGFNRPPVAVLVDNQSISTPDSVATINLDASHSYDPECGVLRFFWRQVSPTGNTVLLTNANKPVCIANKLKPGTYIFEVRVVDPMNAFSPKSIVIEVKSAKP